MMHISSSFTYRNKDAVYVACEDGRVYLAYLDGVVLGKYRKDPVAQLNTFGEALEYADVSAQNRRGAHAN